MQFPKLTPLQSRFAASLLASFILVVIYFSLYNPHFAYAAELDYAGDGQSRGGHDHNWERIGVILDGGIDSDFEDSQQTDDEDEKPEQSMEHVGSEQKTIARQAIETNQFQGSNYPGNLNIDAGVHQIWSFPNSSVWAPYAPQVPGLPSNLSQADDYVSEAPPPDDRKRDIRDIQLQGDEPRIILGRQAEAQRMVYISINTCLQPSWNGTSTQTGPPPQLTLYVSTSPTFQNPGPSSSSGNQQVLPLDHGFANFSLDARSSVYLSVAAPRLPTGFTGGWNYEIAASIDGYYHAANTEVPFLHLVDSDTEAALLVTDNLTQADPSSDIFKKWMNLTAPFIVFAQNTNDTRINGLQNSFCGLQNAPAQIMANAQDPQGIVNDVQMGMITRGLGNKPKEQFFVRNLNGSSSYFGFLAMQGNSTAAGPGVVGGGGQVWQSMNFTTKSDGNCQLMYNLTFCSEVAYAVPSNPHTYPSLDLLAALYDNYAYQLYQNFSYSLELVACNTTATAQYSLVKNCDDCAAAYKEWVCAVSMPRCEDFSSQLPYLQQRNMGQPFIGNNTMISDMILQQPYNPMMDAPGGSVAQQQTFISAQATNSTRNAGIIRDMIMPGPYKELLPCKDLCYSLVTSCPAALQFGCPYPGRGLEVAYGDRSDNGELTCSYLGAVYYLNSGSRQAAHDFTIGIGVVASLAVAYLAW